MLEFCLQGLNKAKSVKDGKPIYFSYDQTHDIFFKYDLSSYAAKPDAQGEKESDQVVKLRVHGNFARHFELRLFLKKQGSAELFEIRPRYGFEPYRQLVPYPYTVLKLELPVALIQSFDGAKMELLGQITHVSDHKWSEQLSNFARW